MPRPIELFEAVECVSDARTLWPFLADTNRLNRLCCRKPIRLRPLSNDTAARYLVETDDSGFDLEYEERPYEWIEHERYAVERRLRRGPLTVYEFSVRLAPRDGGGTIVTFGLRLAPRSIFISPIARLQGRRNLRRFAAILREADANLAVQRPETFERSHEAARAGLDAAAEAMRRDAPDAGPLIERLTQLVADGSDHELDRIRPFELATVWEVDRDQLLTVFLVGVQAGMFEMSWDIVCPSCRTTSERVATLTKIGDSAHCQLCDLGFGLDLDRSVEATFRPARAVRRIDELQYCSGGPSRTPHVVAQKILPAGGELVLEAPASPGRYRLFARGGQVASIEVSPGAPDRAVLRLDEQFEPVRVEVGPGGSLQIGQGPGPERHVKLERVEWASHAATAFHLAMNPSFRRRFSGEVLRPGLMLKVQRVTLLFSDLTASTALYTRAGDALAFRLVQEHFELLGKVVERHRGTIVKTIGDSVMASFIDEESAVRAAMEMQQAFPAFLAGHPDAADVLLKCGVHSGPCYAVTANGILDYFGQTANIAARLQGTAGPGETILDDALADRAQHEGWLNGARVTARFDAVLKGLDAPVRAARVVPGG